MYLRRLGTLEHALREHDHGQVVRRVDEPRGAQAAVPAEGAGVGPSVMTDWQNPQLLPFRNPPACCLCSGVS